MKNLTSEIENTKAKLITEKAKLERIEAAIDAAHCISTVFCEEGYAAYTRVRNIEADLAGMYLDQLLTVYPWFKGEALYGEAIINVIGQFGFELLHDKGIIQLCGCTANGKLYTY